MTKKDYLLISNVFRTIADIWYKAREGWYAVAQKSIRGESPDVSPNDIERKIGDLNKIISSLDVIVHGLCIKLKEDNPNFNSKKFKEACGVKK